MSADVHTIAYYYCQQQFENLRNWYSTQIVSFVDHLAKQRPIVALAFNPDCFQDCVNELLYLEEMLLPSGSSNQENVEKYLNLKKWSEAHEAIDSMLRQKVRNHDNIQLTLAKVCNRFQYYRRHLICECLDDPYGIDGVMPPRLSYVAMINYVEYLFQILLKLYHNLATFQEKTIRSLSALDNSVINEMSDGSSTFRKGEISTIIQREQKFFQLFNYLHTL